MRKLVQSGFAVLAFLVSMSAVAGQHPIGFKAWSGPIPEIAPAPGTPLGLANEAFLTKYGSDEGVLGTTIGQQQQLLVLVTHMGYASNIWAKMLSVGDGVQGRHGSGYIVYQDEYTPPSIPYTYYKKVYVDEGYFARVGFRNGTPPITHFRLDMDEKCPMGRAAVVTVGGVRISPTKLINSSRQGYSKAYEYSVNDGQGALLDSIQFSLGGTRDWWSWFGGTTVCPVDVWIRY